MAMGKIVISTSIGAAGLQARDGEHLLLADTAYDYIRILESLLSDSGQMQDMSRKARQFVTDNFDILGLSEKLISFYKEQLA